MAEIKAPEGPGSEGDTEKAKLSLWSQAFLKTGQLPGPVPTVEAPP